MEGLSHETLAIFQKIDDAGKETRGQIERLSSETRREMDRLGRTLRDELSTVSSDLSNTRERLGKLEAKTVGHDIEIRDLKAEQARLEERQEKLISDYDNKLSEHINNCPGGPYKKKEQENKKSSEENKQNQYPKWLRPILISLGITIGGILLSFLRSCDYYDPKSMDSEVQKLIVKSSETATKTTTSNK